MRLAHPLLALCLASTSLADDAANHHFDPGGAHQPAGFPKTTPKIFAVGGKPLILDFSGLPVDWRPVVMIHQINSARLLEPERIKAESTEGGWHIAWTPPEIPGPARYEIRLKGEPSRSVRIETRPPAWLEDTRKALANAVWKAHGLTTEEHSALAILGIRTRSKKAATATLEMQPRQGDTNRRRILWDEENHTLLVWRPGPATGDLEARAPRWWISPAALATDHGLIRFLDLFSEPPLNP